MKTNAILKHFGTLYNAEARTEKRTYVNKNGSTYIVTVLLLKTFFELP